MQIQIFTIPVTGGEEAINDMNRFLRANRVADIQKTVVDSNGIKCWTFCVTYFPQIPVKAAEPEQRKGKIDYREVLDEPVFARFCEMRKIRKAIADNEAIPPFAVFTDAELAELARLDEITPQSMRSVPGIGARKVEKYGQYFCNMTENETGGESDA